MKLLVLGGTVFLGRHIVTEALAAGHEVTLFNRGLRAPELFPEAERLMGDRRGDLAPLAGRRWDAVIDTSGHLVPDVRRSARLLADAVDHYAFISSVNVYPDYSISGIDESTPTAVTDDEEGEMTFDNYGALKAACERAAEEEMPGRTCAIRPGLIVGAYDFSDRFTWWPARVARRGDVLAPGRPERPVQLIDVRDLARWTIRTCVEGITGVFNAVGPEHRLTMGEMLEACNRVSGGDARIEWVDDDFLMEQEVRPWTEMPMWLPESHNSGGVFEIDCRRAIDRGLTFLPLADTIASTLAWEKERGPDRPMKTGLAPEREAELLAAYAVTGR